MGLLVNLPVEASLKYEEYLLALVKKVSFLIKKSLVTAVGVKSIVAPYKIQANGWMPSGTTDLTTKGTVDNAVNNSAPVGTIKLFVKYVTAGL